MNIHFHRRDWQVYRDAQCELAVVYMIAAGQQRVHVVLGRTACTDEAELLPASFALQDPTEHTVARSRRSPVPTTRNEKSAQRRRKHCCSEAKPKIFAPKQTPFPGARDAERQ